jgi:hypothetical protein
VMAVVSNCLNPIIGRIRCLMRRMILLHNIIQVTAASYSNAMPHHSRGFQFGNRPMRSCISIQCDDARCPLMLHRFVEKAFGSGNIAVFASRESTVRPCSSTARYR